MPELTIQEVQKFINDNKENSEVKSYLSQLSKVTVDKLKSAIESDNEIKSFYGSQIDQARDRGIEAWKQNKMPALIQSEVDKQVAKLNPQETPEMKELRETREEIRREREERKREKILNQALTYSNGKMHTELVEYFLGDDYDSTKANIDKFKNIFDNAITEEVNKRLGENGRKIDNNLKFNEPDDTGLTIEKIAKMNNKEFQENKDKIEKFMKNNASR